MDYENQIGAIRTQLGALDAQLDERRTPYLKSQLRFAGHLLDDAVAAARHASENPEEQALWYAFASFSIAHAKQIGDAVHKAGERGGLANVIEMDAY